jgi:ribosomal protein S18 acetylase RimI-like enzyme
VTPRLVELALRMATADDLAALVALNQQLIEDQQYDNPLPPAGLRERMARWVAGEYTVALFELGDEIVAYAVWRDDADGIYVRHFFVARSFRRSGLGRSAFGKLEEQWQGREVRLDVLLHNQRALDFWRAVGFGDFSLILRKRLRH